MKKFYIGLTMLLLGFAGMSQTTIHSNACASATAGWTFTNGTTTQPIQQTGYWLLEDADVIISDAFDVSAYTGGLVLTFDVGTYASGSPDKPAFVEYSLNNGVTWSTTTFTSNTPSSATYVSSTFNIAASTATQFKFRFKKLSTGGRQGVRLDNILFQGYLPTCVTPTLSGATQSATVCAGSGATINLTGLVASTTNNAIDYTINGLAQTQITGITASATGTASFTSAALTAANNGQTLQITKITNGTCTANFTQNVTLSVNPTSVGGTINPTSASVCTGTNSTLLTLSGQTGNIVKWQSSLDNFATTPTDIANTANTLTATNLTQTTSYRAVVKSGVCADANSSAVTITVTNTTTSIAPTATQTIPVATNGTTLTVTPGTNTVTSRQWKYSNVSGGPYSNTIAGQTGLTYVPNFAVSGTYYVVCEVTYGTPCSAVVTSNEVFINVPANSISTSAGSFGPFCNGAANNITLSFAQTGTFTGQFNIQVSDNTGNFPSDATSQLLTFGSSTTTSVTAAFPAGFAAGTGYRVRVVNNTPAYFASGNNGSNIVINATPTVPAAATPAAVCQGSAVTITGAGSTGATTYTYWTAPAAGTQYTTGSPVGYTVTGGNLTTPAALTSGGYNFYIQGENAALCSSSTRQLVTVTINALPATPANPVAATSPSCGPTTLSTITPAAGETYYWQGTTASGTSVTQSTATTYAVATSGTYYVRARNNTTLCWSTTSGSLVVVINTAPGVTTAPVDATVVVGATASFSVVATNTTGYQWKVSTDGGLIYNNVSTGTGATTASYTTPATTLAMSGYKYQCILTGNAPCATVTTTSALLTVNSAPCLYSDFPTTSLPSGWSGSSANDAVASHYQSAPNCRGLGSGADLITSVIDNPTSINFYVDASGSGGQTGTLEYRIGAGAWTSIGTFTATVAGATVNFPLTASPNLSGTANVSFRISSAANTIYIDDVTAYCGPSTPTPQITLTQGATPIASGTGIYTFANQQALTSSAAVTFTINNPGTANLNLTLPITLSNTTDFTLNQSATTTPVTPAGTTTFTVVFNPATTGAKTGLITIVNSAGANYTFTVSGTGTNSNLSTVIDNTNYSTATPEFNINTQYINYIDATSTTTGKFIPMKFRIVDGPDADALPTILTGIKFTVKDLTNANQLAQIKTAILTNTAGTVIATATKVGTELVFTGMSGANVTAADDDAAGKIVHLRVSLDETQVIDQTKLIFQVSSVTSDVAGSSFATANGGGAQTDAATGNGRNVLNVTATKLAFTVQPVNTAVNTNMSPSPAVAAVDIYNRTDVDVTGAVSITSTGTLTTSPQTATLSSGLATFAAINHTAAGTGFTLSATYGGLTTAVSTTFDITTIVYVDGDYRTIGSGVWNSNSATPAIWQRRSGGIFSASNSPSYSTTNNIYIQNGNTITTNGSFSSGANLKIMSGGTFNCNHQSTTASIYIYNGGNLKVSESLTNTGTLDVEDNGNLYLDNAYSTGTAPIWNGTENFRPASNLYVYDWHNGTPLLTSANVTQNTYSGYTAAFGNIYIDWASSLTGTTPAGDWDGLVGAGTYNICHKNLEFVSARGNTNYKIAASSAGTYGIGGNLILDAGMGSSKVLQLKSGSGAVTFNIKGDVVLDCAGDLVLNSGSVSTCTLNIDGNLLMNQTNTAATTEVKYTSTTTSSPAAILATINLKGNLLATNGSFSIPAGPITAVSAPEPAVLAGELNFTGTTEQLLSMQNSVGSSSTLQGISLKVKSGAIVRLANYNLILWQNSSLRIEDGGTFDFGFNGTTPLIVTQPTTAGGSNWFRSYQGSTLRITSADGITTTTGVGNVQVTASNRSYDQLAKFYYIGKANQFTGNGLTTGSTGKLVYVILPDNNTTLTLSNNTGISNGVTLDALGGKLEIQKGIVIGATGADFTGTGRVVMSDGEYRISTITATPASDYLPQLAGYSGYALTGGIINLNGTNATQILSGTPNYYKISFSGSNTLASNYKGISTGTSVANAIRIYETAIVDVKGNTLGLAGTPTFTMENTSRYITAGTGVKPDAKGAYALAPGTTIEFNTNLPLSLEEPRLIGPIPAYANIVVSGTNVGTTALGTGANSFIQFQSGGSFTVTSAGIFRLTNIYGFSGAANTAISNGNSPQINLQAGSTIDYNGDAPNSQVVSNAVVTTPSSANYVNLSLNGSATKTFPITDITITGNLHRGGTHTVNPQTGRFIFTNVIAQKYDAATLTKPFDFYNLTNNNTSAAGLSIDSTLGVLNEFKLNTGSKLILTAGDINMRSSAARTAYIPNLGATVPTISYAGAGRFIMERYLASFKAWRFVSTPVESLTSQTVKQAWQENGSALTSTGYGTQITGPSAYIGMDAQTATGSLKWYDMATHTYKYVTNTGSLIGNKTGYMVYVRGDRGVGVGGTTKETNLRIKGQINTGQQTFTVSGNETQSFGNPYPAAISYDLLKSANSGLGGYYIAWDPTLNGSYGAGGYQTISSITIPAYQATAAIPGTSAIYSTGSSYPNIQSGQAVFIAKTTAGVLNGVVNEDMKANGSINVSRGGEEQTGFGRSFIHTKLFTNTGDVADGNIMAYDTDFSNEIDGLDAPKYTNGGENFGLKNGSKKLSVEARRSIEVADTVQYDMSNLREQEYKLTIVAQNFNGKPVEAFFVDRYLKAESPLSLSDSNFITFKVTAETSSKVADRFYIVFRKAIVPPSVKITSATETAVHAVKVAFKAENAPNIKAFVIERSNDGINFQPLGQQNASALETYVQEDVQPFEGDDYYRVRAVNVDGSTFFSNIAKVTIGKAPSFITVYPNPVSGKLIHLYVSGQSAGKYSAEIINTIGQKVYQGSITITGRYESKEISVPALVAGTYLLKIRNEKSEVKSIQLVIE